MIAEILFELAWKSTVVAAAVVTLLMAMRRQQPEDRAIIGGVGVALLLVLPLVVLGLAMFPVSAFDVATPAATVGATLPLLPEPAAPFLPVTAMSAAEPATAIPAWMLPVAWAVGAAFVMLRLLSGLLTLNRWTERADIVASPAWNAVMRGSCAPPSTLLMVSGDAPSPLSWGWRMPVILVDRDTFSRAEEAEAIIAHEAAHLRRGDWPRLIAARLVVALFWFNPFVWLLERVYLQDIEEAADAEATRRVAPARYAQALLNVARTAVPLGANSMASGALAKRVRRVLANGAVSRWQRMWRIGALSSVAMIAGPVALVQFVAPAVSAATTRTPAVAPVATAAPVASPIVIAPTAVSAPSATAAPAAPIAVATAAQAAAPSAPVPPDAVIAVTTAIAAVSAQTTTTRKLTEAERESIRDAARAAREAGAQARIAAREAREIAAGAREQARVAQAEARVAMANARVDMRRGADEMDRGAIEMRRGAAQMREEARKLRDPAYRRKVMADNAARGHPTTEQDLIDAIPKMEEGARKMDDGVIKMQEGARKMRAQAARQ